MKNDAVSAGYPDLLKVSLKSPKTLFAKQNLKVGWALFWRTWLWFGLIGGASRSVTRDFGNNNMAAIVGVVFFVLLLIVMVIVAKRVARKQYGKDLRGVIWPYMWRAGVGTLFVLCLFFLVGAIMIGMGVTSARSPEEATTAPILLLPQICMGVVVLGWALHRQLEILSNDKQ